MKTKTLSAKTKTLSAKTSIKEELSKTIDSLDAQRSEAQDQNRYFEALLFKWGERANYAKDLIAGTEDPDALEALQILKAQAEDYVGIYTGTVSELTSYIDSVNAQLKELEKAFKSLELMERKREINEHLRSISSERVLNSLGESAGYEGTVESREVVQLIHTAQALVELRSGKTV